MKSKPFDSRGMQISPTLPIRFFSMVIFRVLLEYFSSNGSSLMTVSAICSMAVFPMATFLFLDIWRVKKMMDLWILAFL